jgi:hypothetical protein
MKKIKTKLDLSFMDVLDEKKTSLLNSSRRIESINIKNNKFRV